MSADPAREAAIDAAVAALKAQGYAVAVARREGVTTSAKGGVMDILAMVDAALRAYAAVPIAPSALADVAAERRRQVDIEGWTAEHDDAHMRGDLAEAAAAYAHGAFVAGIYKDERQEPPWFWPWSRAWWKPRGGRDDLVRAGALILAEIERHDRAEVARG